MTALTETAREDFPDAMFALEDRRAFPMPDSEHARAARMDAGRALRAGHITPAQKSRIDACASEVLRTGLSLAQLRAQGWQPDGV